MSKLLICFFAILCALTLITTDAHAKRFGGGRSFGAHRTTTSSFASPRSIIPPAARSSASRWLGPLAGLAAGGLLASLFMHNGMGSGMLSWLAIAAVGYLLFSLLKNKTNLLTQPRAPFSPAQDNYYQNTNAQQFSSSSSPGFDKDAFLRDAKVQFLRLQTAYDQKNLNDIRVFTTPEVFAEIQIQLQERGSVENVTEVTVLNVDFLDVAHEANGELASVRFYGMVREEVNADPVPLNETWNFQRASTASKWIVAGIQQN